jgi:hypothetical protein
MLVDLASEVCGVERQRVRHAQWAETGGRERQE